MKSYTFENGMNRDSERALRTKWEKKTQQPQYQHSHNVSPRTFLLTHKIFVVTECFHHGTLSYINQSTCLQSLKIFVYNTKFQRANVRLREKEREKKKERERARERSKSYTWKRFVRLFEYCHERDERRDLCCVVAATAVAAIAWNTTDLKIGHMYLCILKWTVVCYGIFVRLDRITLLFRL